MICLIWGCFRFQWPLYLRWFVWFEAVPVSTDLCTWDDLFDLRLFLFPVTSVPEMICLIWGCSRFQWPLYLRWFVWFEAVPVSSDHCTWDDLFEAVPVSSDHCTWDDLVDLRLFPFPVTTVPEMIWLIWGCSRFQWPLYLRWFGWFEAVPVSSDHCTWDDLFEAVSVSSDHCTWDDLVDLRLFLFPVTLYLRLFAWFEAAVVWNDCSVPVEMWGSVPVVPRRLVHCGTAAVCCGSVVAGSCQTWTVSSFNFCIHV